MSRYSDLFSHYPTPEEVDGWIDSIWKSAESSKYDAEILPQNGFTWSLGINHFRPEFRYVKFNPVNSRSFYAYWQPAHAKPAPLLVHVPGYGAEISTHPELVMQGYNVLHISPLGYTTPDGQDESLKKERVINGHKDREWPVLPDTVASGAEKGYKEWLINCLQAIFWAQSQGGVEGGRISFFGSSQGGGGALLLGSIFRDRGVRCVAADVPFLTNFPLAEFRGAYQAATPGFDMLSNPADGWRALGFIDTLSHARRLTVPVLLTSGDLDPVTPPDTIESLFERLPGTRSYTRLAETGHRYTIPFMQLTAAWFRLYA